MEGEERREGGRKGGKVIGRERGGQVEEKERREDGRKGGEVGGRDRGK